MSASSSSSNTAAAGAVAVTDYGVVGVTASATADDIGNKMKTVTTTTEAVNGGIQQQQQHQHHHHPHNHHDEFYLRLYVGHKSKAHGHEFMEFEVCPSGKLRYANNSPSYDGTNGNGEDGNGNNNIIRRQVCLMPAVVAELKRIIRSSDIDKIDDASWDEIPSPQESRQELEIKIGNEHIAFTTACANLSPSPHNGNGKKDANDPKQQQEGLKILYFLTQDLKCFVMSLISLHFKIKPIPVS